MSIQWVSILVGRYGYKNYLIFSNQFYL
jgi:hypothetical protein